MESYYARKETNKKGISRIVVVKKIERDLKSKAIPNPDLMWEIMKMDDWKWIVKKARKSLRKVASKMDSNEGIPKFPKPLQ